MIVAAGRGERLGCRQSKALTLLGGRPLVSYCLRAFRAAAIDEIIIVAPPDDVEPFRELVAAAPPHTTEKVVAGGATRQESVMCGLRELSADMECVLIHDAARPFVSPTLIESCAATAGRYGAALAAVPVSDTLKRAEGEMVRGTVDRRSLWAAQTPQAFRVDLITAAYQRAVAEGAAATDDAGLVEALGAEVRLVMGSPQNLKVTYPEDLALAESLVAARGGAGALRCGIGYDVHRLVEGRRLVLGGVEFAGALGLLGHSDADVLTHAVCDAVLGAAGLGDIGRLFPDTDPQYADADSLQLLRRAVTQVAAAGFVVHNVDAVVVAERPRIADHVGLMQQRLADALGVSPACVNLKGKTSEGLGFVGVGAGIASHAVCTLAPRAP